MPPLFFRFLHHYSIEELSPSALLCVWCHVQTACFSLKAKLIKLRKCR